jgi:molybdopterin/thiamine biosynthesis adenylyltransferase
MVIPQVGEAGQEKLLSSRVLVVGLGGLGSPAAYYLAAAGVGVLGLADGDSVSESNLHRQIVHGASTVGLNKTVSAAIRLRDLNPDIEIRTHPEHLTPFNATDIIGDYEVVLSCLDSMEARYMLNDACVASRKPLVEGGVMRFSGLVTTIIPGSGPCYRCIFPQVPATPTMSPAEAGIVGPVPGVIGSVQAMEALKIVLGTGDLLVGRLLLVDLMDGSFREVKVSRDASCPACGAL